ncbi:hypothetical protein [Lacticaseibacillus parakribbianus]|uniref:hypothetical protein n=1 Tax=Lacticaseibacillus parakribbianus TaxID=2970927 RepID=UPI0021CB2D19|nr:hypothetical protein [Lacticaseibacillus parakribbianus]
MIPSWTAIVVFLSGSTLATYALRKQVASLNRLMAEIEQSIEAIGRLVVAIQALRAITKK